jgi:Tfp pilus assembly protein PilX
MTLRKRLLAAKSRILKPLRQSKLDNQDGIVLIIVLITMLLLTLLGASLMDGTTSELKIAGNASSNQIAFYSADAALNFAESFDQIYTSLSNSSPVWPAAGQGVYYNSASSPALAKTTTPNTSNLNFNAIVLPNGVTALVKVQKLSTGNLPPGYGTQESSSLSGTSSFVANYFVVTATAAPNPNSGASVTVESQIAKVVPQSGQ